VGDRCFVIEDSAHEYETTLAALTNYARFVPPGGHFVVEDGSVDIDSLRVMDEWPRGVLPALQDWLRTPAASEFSVRRDLELYGITSHPAGFLERSQGGSQPTTGSRDADLAAVAAAFELAPADVVSLAERRLGQQNDILRNQIASLEERLQETDRVRELLLEAEQRLASVPDLQAQVADLERELARERQAAQNAREQAAVLDQRLTISERVLADVLNSPSWRVTKPLRSAKRVLRS
jgi:hypothetical protein